MISDPIEWRLVNQTHLGSFFALAVFLLLLAGQSALSTELTRSNGPWRAPVIRTGF